MAYDGACVVCVDLDSAGGETVAAEVGGLFVKAEVSNEGDVREMHAAAVARYGGIDIAFNNAGISPVADASILETDLATWQNVQHINLTSVYLCCKYVIPHMLERRRGPSST